MATATNKKNNSSKLEMVFNLQWLNKPDKGGDNNIIGMVDTPMTTINFDSFKYYLLKNSGVSFTDVKVTYLTDNGREWVIESQADFPIALSAFRLKARLGEVIYLKLQDRSADAWMIPRKSSNDVETQFDQAAAAPIKPDMSEPPEWFVDYMQKFKAELVDQLSFDMNMKFKSAFRQWTPQVAPPPPAPVLPIKKKLKPDSLKSTSSKRHSHRDEGLYHKFEQKLDKLDAKSKKIKEKKQAIISKIDRNGGEDIGRHYANVVDEHNRYQMDAAPCTSSSFKVPHLLGGEIYMHTWNVMNTGKVAWGPKTELRLTWGSFLMKPTDTVIVCPQLKPGETGIVRVCFNIPKAPGQYESYWNFYNKGVRFGHWLSFNVIVDASAYNLSKKKPKIEDVKAGDAALFTPMIALCPPKKEEASVIHKKEPVVTTEAPAGLKEEYISPEIFVFSPPQRSLHGSVPDASDSGNLVMDLSNKLENVDDFDNLIREMNKDIKNLQLDKSTNSYGITEEELIVDLASSAEIVDDAVTNVVSNNADDVKILNKEESEPALKHPTNRDDQNNNNTPSRNHSVTSSSTASICEVDDSDDSDVSSGYDVINGPMMCEEEREDSGYVYITIDGSKLPVPKHIVRPEFLATAEEAPAPASPEPEKERGAATASETSVDAAAAAAGKPAEESRATAPPMQSPVSAATSAARMFIFPCATPGFEVEVVGGSNASGEMETGVADGRNAKEQVDCPTNKVDVMPTEPTYTWAQPQTHYTSADVNPALLKCDPYGPPDTARPRPHHQYRPSNPFGFIAAPSPRSTSPCSWTSMSPCSPDEGECHRSSSTTSSRPSVGRAPPPPPSSHSSARQCRTPPPPRPPSAAHQKYAGCTAPQAPPLEVHLLPENLMTGAVNVASSAINTARSVINMIVPQKSEPGKWVNGHWVPDSSDSARSRNLRLLAEMGFWDTDLNATLLARFKDDMARVINELVQ